MANIVEVKDLVKVYKGKVRAVDGISFHVEEGEIFGFLGPNGAGKTTAIKIITTLLRKTTGKVTVGGFDIDESAAQIRDIIGYASQSVGLDNDLTGRENLRLECSFHHIEGERADRIVEDLIKRIDLEDAADRRAGTYSGGMRRRLDLATALVSSPRLLFLDEPTTGLDPQSRQAVWDYVRSLNEEGMTIFLTTQYMEEADRLADRLCIIDHGKIVAEGSPSQLKSQIRSDMIQVEIKDSEREGMKEKAMEAVRSINGVQDVQDCDVGSICESGIVIFAENGSSLIASIVRAMDEKKVVIEQLTLSAPSLDEVFLKFTGRKLRVEEPSSQSARRRRRGPF